MTPMSWALLVGWALTSLGMFAYLVRLETSRTRSLLTPPEPTPTGPVETSIPTEPMVPASLLQDVMAAYARLMEQNQAMTRSMMSELGSTVSALVSPPPVPSSPTEQPQVRREADPWELFRSPAEQREAMEGSMVDMGAPAGWATVPSGPASGWQSEPVGPSPPPNEMMGTGGLDPSSWDPSP